MEGCDTQTLISHRIITNWSIHCLCKQNSAAIDAEPWLDSPRWCNTEHQLLNRDGGGGWVTCQLCSLIRETPSCNTKRQQIVYISTLQNRLWTGVLMPLWAISVGGTGGKVCSLCCSVQWSLGRLTDEGSEGCNSSRPLPCLAIRRHAEIKCLLIYSVVSCCDSSFVNVWTLLFKHHHLVSLWLFSFSLRDVFLLLTS